MLDGTQTKISQVDVADRETLIVDLQGPSSYDAAGGGEAVLPSQFPFRTGGILIETVEGNDDSTLASCKYDPSNATLKFYTAAGVEEVNTTDLSANTYRLTVSGR